jgi:MFS family permease
MINHPVEGTPPIHVPTPRVMRLAITIIFAVHGMIFASWASRIPQVQQQLDLSEGELGIALLGMPVGLLLALPLIGGMVAHFGSRRVTLASGYAYCLMLPLLVLAPSTLVLWLILFFFGMVTGTMDVAMNSQAVEVERVYKRSIMASFHAAFSIGGFIGAGLGSLLIRLGLTIFPHMVFISLSGILILFAVRSLLLEVPPTKATTRAQVFSFPSKALLPIGIIAFCSSVGEGAMADWSTVYMRRIVETSPSTAALGFAAFSLMMTVGRASGDYLIERFSRRLVVRGGGLIASIGLFVVVLLPYTPTAILGFAGVGIGLSFIIPIVFSAAGNMPGTSPSKSIASVATLGYMGFLAGAPTIGLIAELTSLRVSLGLVAMLIFCLVFLAEALRPVSPAIPTDLVSEQASA